MGIIVEMGEKKTREIGVASVTLPFSAELIILPAGHFRLFNFNLIHPELDKRVEGKIGALRISTRELQELLTELSEGEVRNIFCYYIKSSLTSGELYL